MTVTAASIKAKFPEFASIDNAYITEWIAHAELNHNAECWAGKSDEALCFMIAHFLAAFPQGDSESTGVGPGPLTAQTEGSESASWSPLTVPKAFAEDDYGTTKYGRRYLSMRKRIFCCRCT